MKEGFSIILPVHNESKTIADLAMEIEEVMIQAGCPWECIWVDDGSSDGSEAQISKLIKNRPEHHRLIRHRTNRGQSAALLSGFHAARYPLFITMDADGQNMPGDIPELVAKMKANNADMVQGIRINRKDTWRRNFSSGIANRFRSLLIGDGLKDVGCTLRVFRRECIEGMPRFMGYHRFIAVLTVIRGACVVEHPVRHRNRTHGKSHYGVVNRLGVGIADTLCVCWMKKRMFFRQERPEGLECAE
jgi:dolichol-phosphate mannosyltransferase